MRFLSVLLLCLLIHGVVWAERPRVLVLTDISNEPDDEESLVRFLVYANEYDVEGLVATTSTWLHVKPREDLIRRHIAAYGQVRDNLAKHAPGYPTPEQLLAVTCTGQAEYGLAAVGAGHATAGSRHLLAAARRAIAPPTRRCAGREPAAGSSASPGYERCSCERVSLKQSQRIWPPIFFKA